MTKYFGVLQQKNRKEIMTTDTPVSENTDILQHASDIVSAYVGRNQLGRDELAKLLVSVHGTLSGLSGQPASPEEETTSNAPLVPAVPIDQSVTEDAIICLEDGKAFKTLKRHLSTSFGMSPDEYRAKWGLSKDYPMVAPSYSKRRSDTAKAIGLGQKAAPAPKPKARRRKTAGA